MAYKDKEEQKRKGREYYQRIKAYRKEWYEANKTRLQEAQREIYHKHAEARKDQMGEWRNSNKYRIAIYKLKTNFDITEEFAEELYERSTQTCECCGVEYNSETHKKRFAVDHNHATNKIRGILCHPCNTSLGLLKEDLNRLKLLANYIETHSDNK
jgi:hypothetical protein